MGRWQFARSLRRHRSRAPPEAGGAHIAPPQVQLRLCRLLIDQLAACPEVLGAAKLKALEWAVHLFASTSAIPLSELLVSAGFVPGGTAAAIGAAPWLWTNHSAMTHEDIVAEQVLVLEEMRRRGLTPPNVGLTTQGTAGIAAPPPARATGCLRLRVLHTARSPAHPQGPARWPGPWGECAQAEIWSVQQLL